MHTPCHVKSISLITNQMIKPEIEIFGALQNRDVAKSELTSAGIQHLMNHKRSLLKIVYLFLLQHHASVLCLVYMQAEHQVHAAFGKFC